MPPCVGCDQSYGPGPGGVHAPAAFWVREPGRGEIRPERVRRPGPGEVLVRTLHSGVSRGTETLVFRGRVPAEPARRRCGRRTRTATSAAR